MGKTTRQSHNLAIAWRRYDRLSVGIYAAQGLEIYEYALSDLSHPWDLCALNGCMYPCDIAIWSIYLRGLAREKLYPR